MMKGEMMKQFFKDIDYNDDILSDFTTTPIRELTGHQRAVREIAYSETHKIIVSCGFDFEVFVWNPYMKTEIMRLDGHEHPLVGVNCLPALNCFITADDKGIVKVWNILDYSCIQTFQVTNGKTLTCIRAVPKHRRLLCGSRIFKVFQYQRPFIPEFSDDHPICCAKFSAKNFEIYVAGERSVKIWDAKTGKPVRVLKNVFPSGSITTMEFDQNHRKLIIGSNKGELKVYDLLSGIMTHELEPHDGSGGEIAYIGYGGDDHTIVTAGWDRTVKVHMDERLEHISLTKKVKRGKVECHSKDLICGDYGHYLGLIATGGRDNKVRIWDYERIIQLNEITAHETEVSLVKFLFPFPLLLTSDLSGYMYIWLTKPHEKAGACVLQWRNQQNLKDKCPITAVDCYYNGNPGEKKFWLFQGDESGSIRVQDLWKCIEEVEPRLEPVDVTVNNLKRNAHREFAFREDAPDKKLSDETRIGSTTWKKLKVEAMAPDYKTIIDNKTSNDMKANDGKTNNNNSSSNDTNVNNHRYQNLSDDDRGLVNALIAAQLKQGDMKELQPVLYKKSKKVEEEDDSHKAGVEPILKEGSIQQVFHKQDGESGHSDVIRSIQYISCTDTPLIMTASLDRKVRIIDLDGVDHGTLKQGY